MGKIQVPLKDKILQMCIFFSEKWGEGSLVSVFKKICAPLKTSASKPPKTALNAGLPEPVLPEMSVMEESSYAVIEI